MFEPPDSPHRVPFDSSFSIPDRPTSPPEQFCGDAAEEELEDEVDDISDELYDIQRRFWADGSHALLLIFQALDAAGKDSTIRHVFREVNPAGVAVHPFKAPSAREVAHDFLWRTTKYLPRRGMIGIFNRSYYEEVLVVRVHPRYLDAQRLPTGDLDRIWQDRYRAIREHERHLNTSGTVVLKFWLNMSRSTQKHRFLRRIRRPDKNWKFSLGDVDERQHWDAYMEAYQDALNATSRPWAPWYAIPADSKPYMRREVGRIILETLEKIDPQYPTVSDADRRKIEEGRERLQAET